ncbi:late expression factor 12 [Malacosoma neustria nucleopolyhedrovirus]|uniref:late expression factor 12 n=1 Tax=Malacosoma neustria nuclear polyhedrosis virus TaxID=38012 RepID=UPI000E35C163|nr:late expression factor 12 [Malacosoma neustria nucleopolyhedrovirus]AUF81565.1 late expression factor 12 [Malacosoma neustria nucleopolyhedrovirus]
MKFIKVVNVEKYRYRLNRLKPFVDYVKMCVEKLHELNLIKYDEMRSLCLSDDTATWVCGKLKTSNFVTFRLLVSPTYAADDVTQLFAVLSKAGFEQSVEQTLVIARDPNAKYLIYDNFSLTKGIVAIRLIVIKSSTLTMLYSNPCLQLSYFINVYTGGVATRDCDCLNTCVELRFDKTFTIRAEDAYYKMLIAQSDLVDEKQDDGTTVISCDCVSGN